MKIWFVLKEVFALKYFTVFLLLLVLLLLLLLITVTTATTTITNAIIIIVIIIIIIVHVSSCPQYLVLYCASQGFYDLFKKLDTSLRSWCYK